MIYVNDKLIKKLVNVSAFIIQFSFIACFFWLNVMCIETWLLVRHHVSHCNYRRIQPKTLFFYYSIWAWGPPAILILVSMAMDLSPTIPMTYVKPSFGRESCWFKCEFWCIFSSTCVTCFVRLNANKAYKVTVPSSKSHFISSLLLLIHYKMIATSSR